MTYTADYIQDKLEKELEPSYIEIRDMSDDCGLKFGCVVVSSKFEGKPLLQRHRLVNSILEEEMKTIHAFTQKTLTPEQWQKQQSQS